MNKNLLKLCVLPLILAITVGSIYFLPEKGNSAECSISMELPLGLNPRGWSGERRQETERERTLLAADTKFAKADYKKELSLDEAMNNVSPTLCHVSIVRSGVDLNNSIHRPERCLPAQGHYDLKSSIVSVPIDGHGSIRMTKLDTKQNVTQSNSSTPIILNSMHYYVFIGHKQITHNHIERTFLDMQDRVLFGRDQHWAYFQISTAYGEEIGISKETAKANTELLINQLLTELIQWNELSE